MTGPDNRQERHHYGVLFGINEGRLLAKFVRDAGGTVVEGRTYEYVTDEQVAQQPAQFPFPSAYGIGMGMENGFDAKVRPVRKTVIARGGTIVEPPADPLNTEPPSPPPPPPPPRPPCEGDEYGNCERPWVLPLEYEDAATTMVQATDPADLFTNEITQFDPFALPKRVTKGSTSGASRTEVTAYHHNEDKWILGQVASLTCVAPAATCIHASKWPNGMEVSKTTYTDVYALPEHVYAFGKLQRSYTWTTTTGSQDGTLRTLANGAGNVTTFGSWKRGIPQAIRSPVTDESPDGAIKRASVDDNGWITSVTDENGATTGYQYDGTMGRLTQVTYPTEAAEFDVVWNATTMSFAPTGGAVYGLPAGHWVQTISTGNGRKRTRYDALWRPVVEEVYDNADPDDTRSIVVKRYDTAGRVAFQSHPLRTLNNWATATTGTITEYDALDRVTETRVPSADPGATNGAFRSKIEYLTGFRQKATSPNNTVTTTSYLAWDEPTTDYPVAIAHPEGAYTDIARDALGKPTAITRHNASASVSLTRRLVYRSDTQELCKTIEPETGATVMDYDEAGNLAWSAAGMNLTGASDCSYGGVPTAARTLRSYDARNRLESLSFPDGNGDQDWEYRPNGLPSKVTTWNIGAPGAAAKETFNIYVYNKRGLLEAETVAVPAWYTFKVDHQYNGNGHVVATSYPSSSTIDFAVNALGHVSGVLSGGMYLASDVSYYPNGAVEHLEYGNGIVHTMDQNDRQLPRRSWTRKDGVHYLDDVYAYDGNGNVEGITDNRPSNQGGGTRSRAMTYDGLDRLETVASPMYGITGAFYSYNVLDDLTRVKIGGAAARDHYYCYNTSHRLESIRTAACSGGGGTVHGLGYDVQGNLANKDGQHYQFDYGNRLREVIDVERYRYDAYGRRVLAMQFATGTVLSMYGQDGRLMYQRNDRTGKQSDYLYLNNSLVAIRDEPIGGGARTLRYQHTDALGSPVAVTSPGRTVLESTEYEPFGKVLNRSVHDGPGYAGHVEDAATGLVQMQQRYYDPEIGRFLSVDPVTARSNPVRQFNRYRYGNSNPYKFVDPDGRYSCSGGDQGCKDVAKGLRDIRTARNTSIRGGEARSQLNKVVEFFGKSDVKVDVGLKSETRLGQAMTYADGTTKVSVNHSSISQYSDKANAMASVLMHEGIHGIQQRDSIAATGGMTNIRRHLRANEVFATLGEYHYAKASGSDVFDLVNDKTGNFNKDHAVEQADAAVKSMCRILGACSD